MSQQLSFSKEDERFLSQSYKSKGIFVQRYKQLYYGKSKSKDLYLLILTKLRTSVSKGNLDDFKIYESLIEYISEEESSETLKIYYDDLGNPIKTTNLIILACEFDKIEILDHILSFSKILFHLSNNIGKGPVKPNDEDETCHNAFYYAVRSNNAKLLDTLINKWSNNYFVVHPEKLEEVLSKAYEELKLKNVSLSTKMEIFVERKLIDLRFFSNLSGPIQKAEHKLDNITERINLVLENINLLSTEYSSEKDVDDKFLFVAKFVAQNILVLKRQLKSTYDELPWEEIEFCLASFISSYLEQQEINAFCRAIISKNKMLCFLNNFAKKLHTMEIVDVSKLTKLPYLKREDVVPNIIKKDPQFTELYHNFCQIRDIYSLHTMSCYITHALSAKPKSRTAQFSIIRALQVIGENLKNTWMSPKLSDGTCKLLLLSLSKNTANIITELRDSLSHANSLFQRMQIEKNIGNKFFFADIQKDINKVDVAIREILHDKKLEIILALLEKITNTKKSSEIKEFSDVLHSIQINPKILGDCFESREHNKIETRIKELKNKISNITDYEKNLFNKIQEIIDSKKPPIFKFKKDYALESIEFLSGRKKLNSCDIKEMNTFIEDIKANILPRVGSGDLKKISTLVLQIHESVWPRLKDHCIWDVMREIFYIAQFETSEIQRIEEMHSKLCSSGKEKNVQDYGLKIGDNYSGEVDRKLPLLKNILQKHGLYDQLFEKFPSYKTDRKLQSTVEMLVLDIMSILGELRSLLPCNTFYLDDDAPSLVGKSLRNYLAHGDVLTDVLSQSNPKTAVLMNAIKLTEGNSIKNNMSKIGKLLNDDPFKLRKKYIEGLAAIVHQERMFTALVNGKLDDLTDSLKKGADIHAKCINSRTALHFAAMGPDLEVFKFIYNKNSSLKCLHAKDRNGQNPLHVAVACGRRDIVEFIVKERSMRINDLDNDGNTPLHIAAQNGPKSVVALLSKNIADHSIRNIEGLTSLHCAAKNNRTNVVKILLGEKMNVDVHKVRGNLTLLHTASKYGCLGLVEFLLTKNANVNAVSDNHWTPLHYSSRNGNKEIACTLIERGANINARSIQGDAPLHLAAEHGNFGIVKVLLNKGANVNVKSISDNITPLHSAAEKGYYDVVQLLLDSGADPNSKDRDDFTPLHTSVLRDCHTNVIEALIQNKSNVNAKNNMGNTPLHLVVKSGKEKAVNILLKCGANIHVKNKQDYTPVELAVLKGNLQILKTFLRCEKSHLTINAKGNHDVTLLHLAAGMGNTDITGYLLANGANVNCKSSAPNNETPLHFTAENGNYETAKLLIKNGASVCAKNGRGLEPMHIAAGNGHKKVVEILIQGNANINAKNEHNITPLYCATQNGHLDIIELLIDKGANVNVRSSEGFTPLCAGIHTGIKKIVEEFIRKGAETDIVCDDNRTLLHMAASDGHNSIVEILLKNECNVNARNAQDATAVELAVLNNHIETVKTLLQDERVNINAIDSNKYTILHIAAQSGHLDIVKYLIKKGADLDMRTIHGHTAKELAIYKGHIEVVQAFKVKDADANFDKTAEELEACFVYRHFYDSDGRRLDASGSKAKECLPEFLKLRENHRGSSHLKTAEVLIQMGKVEMAGGNYRKAEEVLERALKIQESDHGSENAGQVETLINLGEVYAKLANPPKHRDVLERALRFQENNHGTESSELVDALVSLSIAYGNLGNQLKKKELLERALKIQEKHHDTDLRMARTLMNLGNVYGALGNPLKQKELLEKTLEFQKKCSDSDRISIANTLNNLGVVHLCSGDLLTAKKQLEQALEIKEEHYGNEHAELCSTLSNLGVVYTSLGDHQQCKKVLNHALKIQKKLYGTKHFKLADTLFNLGRAYGALRNFQKKKELLKKAVSISEMHYGCDHIETKIMLLNLGIAYAELQNNEEAMELFERVLKIYERHYGIDHFEIVGVLNNLSKCCDALRLHQKNLEFIERALDIQKKHYGSEHSSVALTLMKLSSVYKDLADYQKEKVVIEQAIKIQEKSTGCDCIEVARMLIKLGSAFVNLGNPWHAQKMFKKASSIFEKTFGSQNPEFLGISAMVETLIHQCAIDIQKTPMLNESNGTSNALPCSQETTTIVDKEENDLQTVRRLLKNKNDVNFKDAEGRTPLHYAINSGKLGVVRILLEKGADVTQATNKGNTPLHTATSKDHTEIVEVLLQHVTQDKMKEFVNAKTTSSGTTSLHVAAKNGCPDIVKSLLRHGAIYNVVNNEGKMPLDFSKNQKITDLLNLIEKLFKDVEKGSVEITNKLKALEPDEFSVVTNAVSDQGHGLLQFATVMTNKYKRVESELPELFLLKKTG